MYSGNRAFRPNDSDFPTTKALQQHLSRVGRIADGAAPASDVPSPEPPRQLLDEPAAPADSFVLGLLPKSSRQPARPLHVSLPKLMAGRCLIQGSSGAGKSWALRRIVEQASRRVGIIIVDPEGDFCSLAAHIGAATVKAGEIATDGLTQAALGARHHRLNIHLDLTDLEPDARIAKAAAFFAGLLASPRDEWTNTFLVAIDEAHLLAPHMAASARDAETRRLGVATLTDLCARGRKRGLAPVIATQRLAKLAASVVSELHNFLLGLNVFDRDVARAGDLLGYSYDKAATLRDLAPGQFYGIGPALASTPQLVTIDATETRHVGDTPDLMPSAGMAPEAAHDLLGLDALREAAPARPVAARGPGQRVLDGFVLEAAAADAVRIVTALAAISPNATTTSELEKALHLDRAALDAALDLLAHYGLVDTIPRAEQRIARLGARLRLKLADAPIVGLA